MNKEPNFLSAAMATRRRGKNNHINSRGDNRREEKKKKTGGQKKKDVVIGETIAGSLLFVTFVPALLLLHNFNCRNQRRRASLFHIRSIYFLQTCPVNYLK